MKLADKKISDFTLLEKKIPVSSLAFEMRI